MSAHTFWSYLLTVTLVAAIGSALIIVWQVMAAWRGKRSVAREEAFRKLAEDALATQHRTTDALEKATAELKEIRQHTAEMERMLKEVN